MLALLAKWAAAVVFDPAWKAAFMFVKLVKLSLNEINYKITLKKPFYTLDSAINYFQHSFFFKHLNCLFFNFKVF